jgi:energy-coupling factor transporter ATP-binding protein EcfA2
VPLDVYRSAERRRVTDRTASRYLKRLVNLLGLFNDKGLGLINANRLDLERVYVDLRTASDANLSHPQVDPIVRTVRGNRPFWDFLRTYRPGIAFAIVGPPGCGKTTLIHHVALTYSRRKHRRYHVPFRIPILIELRNVADYIVENNPTLAQLAERAVRELFPRDADRPSVDWFQRHLAAGQCAVLFDGLDEVGDGDKRRTVSRWLDSQINADTTHTNMFAVTSRPAGYKSAHLDRAQVLEVQPFTLEQSHKFIDNWYLANEIVSSGTRTIASSRSEFSTAPIICIERYGTIRN